MTGKTVYFMRPIGCDGPIKIGCSVRPIVRLRDCEIWSPLKLEIIGSAPGEHRHENALHLHFADHRRHGEWFEASPELLALVEQVAETGTLPPMEMLPYKEAVIARRGKMPRRDNAARLSKYRLTKMVHAAEQHALGFGWRGAVRPDEVATIILAYQGFAAPLPAKKEVAILQKYAAELMSQPKANRSYAVWVKRQAAKQTKAA